MEKKYQVIAFVKKANGMYSAKPEIVACEAGVTLVEANSVITHIKSFNDCTKIATRYKKMFKNIKAVAMADKVVPKKRIKEDLDDVHMGANAILSEDYMYFESYSDDTTYTSQEYMDKYINALRVLEQEDFVQLCELITQSALSGDKKSMYAKAYKTLKDLVDIEEVTTLKSIYDEAVSSGLIPTN